MLETIKNLEIELEKKIETAKREAATSLQHARTEASDARVALEQSLREDEARKIATAEAEATRTATALLESAQTATTAPDQEKIAAIAKSIVTHYLS